MKWGVWNAETAARYGGRGDSKSPGKYASENIKDRTLLVLRNPEEHPKDQTGPEWSIPDLRAR